MILTKKKLNINSIQLVLVCLIPLCLIFSRFLADFFLVLICILFLSQSFLDKKNYFNNFFFKLFLIFWIIIVCRSIFSEDLYFSLKSSLPYIRFGVFSVAIWYLFSNNKRYTYYFFLALSFCLISLILDGYIQYFFKKNILNYPITIFYNENVRLSGFFKDELILGSFISRIFPLYLGVYFYSLHNKFIKNNDFFIFIILSLAIILVLLSGERVAFFFMSISFLLGLFFLQLPIKNFLNKIIIGFLIVFSVIFFNKDVKNRLIETTLYQVGITQNKLEKTGDGEKYIYSIHHHNHIIASYKIFKENIIFGSGVKMFRIICDKRYNINAFTCSTHPHNTIMQFLSETGIIGTIFYFASLIYILKSFFINLKIGIRNSYNNLNKSKLFFLSALIISLMPFLPAGNFFNNWISILNFFPLGFYLMTNLDFYKNEY